MNPSTEKIEKWTSVYNRIIREWINSELRGFPELNDSNYYYILLVFEQPGISQKELTEAIFREQSIVTKAINYLIKHDWLRKESDPSDRRRSLIFVTEKGKKSYPIIKDIATRSNVFATEALTAEEAAEMERLLLKAAKPFLSDIQIKK